MARNRKGQSLIEALAGLIILIPIGLSAIDLVAVLTAADCNEHIADTAARAAATQPSQAAAQQAAEEALKNCETSWTVSKVSLDNIEYNLGNGLVTVTTVVQVNLPVPLPNLSAVSFRAEAIEPIVETPAPK